ncbi:MAG: hypothetical protein Q9201_006881 [Fulgogasparrea decipioides]
MPSRRAREHQEAMAAMRRQRYLLILVCALIAGFHIFQYLHDPKYRHFYGMKKMTDATKGTATVSTTASSSGIPLASASASSSRTSQRFSATSTATYRNSASSKAASRAASRVGHQRSATDTPTSTATYQNPAATDFKYSGGRYTPSNRAWLVETLHLKERAIGIPALSPQPLQGWTDAEFEEWYNARINAAMDFIDTRSRHVLSKYAYDGAAWRDTPEARSSPSVTATAIPGEYTANSEGILMKTSGLYTFYAPTPTSTPAVEPTRDAGAPRTIFDVVADLRAFLFDALPLLFGLCGAFLTCVWILWSHGAEGRAQDRLKRMAEQRAKEMREREEKEGMKWEWRLKTTPPAIFRKQMRREREKEEAKREAQKWWVQKAVVYLWARWVYGEKAAGYWAGFATIVEGMWNAVIPDIIRLVRDHWRKPVGAVVGVVAAWYTTYIPFFFHKEEEERTTTLDWNLSFIIAVIQTYAVVFAPIAALFFINWLVGHHDVVEVCNLCSQPVSNEHVTRTTGQKLCQMHRWEEEKRLLEEQRRKEEEAIRKKQRYGDLQTASTLPSGQQFHPVPWPQPPPHPSVFGRSYSSGGAGGRYSDSLGRTPMALKKRQPYPAFKSFGQNMTPVVEDEDTSSAWMYTPNYSYRVPRDTRGHLYYQLPASKRKASFTDAPLAIKSSNKRFS